jgi:hypothetical protein
VRTDGALSPDGGERNYHHRNEELGHVIPIAADHQVVVVSNIVMAPEK